MRIPYQVAVHQLQDRLAASLGEIALWVSGFVDKDYLTAYESSLPDAPRFEFQSGLYPTDPEWLDYDKKLASCYFDSDEVERFAPARRFIPFPEAVRRFSEAVPSIHGPDRLIVSLVLNDQIGPPTHPIAGIPDLNDEVQLSSSFLPVNDVEAAISCFFGSSSESRGTRFEPSREDTQATRPSVAPLDTAAMAAVLHDVGRKNAEYWKRRLSDFPKWMTPAIVARGARGGRATEWNPVELILLLLQRKVLTADHANRLFRTRTDLAGSSEAWQRKRSEAKWLGFDD